MYRGILFQEGNWTREGSHLDRRYSSEKVLDKNIGRGRIYRIIHEDINPDGKTPTFGSFRTELVDYLGTTQRMV